jgi:probable rRNA maturation factor
MLVPVSIDVVVRSDVRRLVGATACRMVANRLRVALRQLGRSRSSATLLFTGDDEIRALNREFRGLDRATDVLSFHMQEVEGETDPAGDGVFLGDIVISVQTARRCAGRARLDRELERLAVHGLCHLFGHDHHRPSQGRRMRALEKQLLAATCQRRALPAAAPAQRPEGCPCTPGRRPRSSACHPA